MSVAPAQHCATQPSTYFDIMPPIPLLMLGIKVGIALLHSRYSSMGPQRAPEKPTCIRRRSRRLQ